MNVFLSGIESSEKTIIDEYIKDGKKIDYCLTSFYYLRKKNAYKLILIFTYYYLYYYNESNA